jgi:uncharacterized membrane protein HdeD (DUF308 family)
MIAPFIFVATRGGDIMDEISTLSKQRGWMILGGILFILFGAFSFSLPVAGTVSLTFALAAVLLASGIVHFIQAVKMHGSEGNFTRYFRAIVSALAGGLMFRYPIGGIMSIALGLSFYFFVSAASQWMLSTRMRSHQTWIRANAILSFVLGVLMIISFPFSAMWVPGLLLGIELVFFGATMISLGVMLKPDSSKASPPPSAPKHQTMTPNPTV